MTSKKKMILIPDRLSTSPDIEEGVFGPDYEILALCATHASQIPDETWGRADAVLAWHDLKYTEDVLKRLQRCKVLVRVGVGFDNVDVEAAGRMSLPVYNVPDYGTNDVADHAIGLMISLARGIYAYSETVRSTPTEWEWNSIGKLWRLKDSVMGIVGLGRIGTATAIRAMAFGMKVKFYDPYIPDGTDKAIGVCRVDSLYELAALSDIVSFHTPLTEETRGMGDKVFFEHLKPNAIVINTSRGPVIRLDDLYAALKSDRVRAAGLDVLETEPPDDGHPLIRAWRKREKWLGCRLMITPHAAFYCEEAYREMRYKAALTAKRVLDGESSRNCVNKAWLPSDRKNES
jgi:phosphoglycerate dehydrogenase-like enzyme